MTITVGFWFWPIALVLVGVIGAVISDIYDGGGLGSGCAGLVFCVICWTFAAGLVAARLAA